MLKSIVLFEQLKERILGLALLLSGTKMVGSEVVHNRNQGASTVQIFDHVAIHEGVQVRLRLCCRGFGGCRRYVIIVIVI